MFYQLAVAAPAGFAAIIVGSAADYTVSVLLVRLVDVKREAFPVSGTLVREMKKEDREKWMA